MKRRMAKISVRLLSIVILLASITGCNPQAEKEKTVIKILYSYPFKQVKTLVESVYEDLELQVEIQPYASEQLRRLEKGIGPDLVLAPQLDADLVQKYLLDLSDTKASTAYDGTIMNATMLEGKTYLIPLPGVYSGYVVNETLFDQAGLPLPTTNEELITSLLTLKEMGLGIGEDDINFSIMSDFNTTIGLFYVGCMVPDFLGTVAGVNWLADFNHKQTTFTGVWESSFDLSNSLIDAGVMDPASIARQRNTILCRERLSKGTLAAAFGNSALYYECVSGNQQEVEAGEAEAYTYKMLPLFSDEGNEPWFLFSPTALMGVNRNISQEKQDACKRILDLLSTPEGQTALMEDLGAGISCLRAADQTQQAIPDSVKPYVESGYIYNVLFPGKTVEYLGGYVRNIMNNQCTVEQALQAVDQFYYEGADESAYDFSIVGNMEQDLLLENFNVRRQETALGNFVADCVAAASQTPLAVVNGGGIRASFYQGVVYGGDLTVVCPFDNEILVVEMDGQTLWSMLENSVSTCNQEFPGGRFLQVAGMQYTFDSRKPVGSRLISVTLNEGKELDRSAYYQVALTDYMLGSMTYAEGNGDGYTMLNLYDENVPQGNVKLVKEIGLTYRDAMKLYFETSGSTAVNAQLEGRITDMALNE